MKKLYLLLLFATFGIYGSCQNKCGVTSDQIGEVVNFIYKNNILDFIYWTSCYGEQVPKINLHAALYAHTKCDNNLYTLSIVATNPNGTVLNGDINLNDIYVRQGNKAVSLTILVGLNLRPCIGEFLLAGENLYPTNSSIQKQIEEQKRQEIQQAINRLAEERIKQQQLEQQRQEQLKQHQLNQQRLQQLEQQRQEQLRQHQLDQQRQQQLEQQRQEQLKQHQLNQQRLQQLEQQRQEQLRQQQLDQQRQQQLEQQRQEQLKQQQLAQQRQQQQEQLRQHQKSDQDISLYALSLANNRIRYLKDNNIREILIASCYNGNVIRNSYYYNCTFVNDNGKIKLSYATDKNPLTGGRAVLPSELDMAKVFIRTNNNKAKCLGLILGYNIIPCADNFDWMESNQDTEMQKRLNQVLENRRLEEQQKQAQFEQQIKQGIEKRNRENKKYFDENDFDKGDVYMNYGTVKSVSSYKIVVSSGISFLSTDYTLFLSSQTRFYYSVSSQMIKEIQPGFKVQFFGYKGKSNDKKILATTIRIISYGTKGVSH